MRYCPLVLDVGTDNKQLLDNPLYLGNRHERVRGKKYHEFVDKFVETAERLFPNLYLHWGGLLVALMQRPFSNATKIRLQHSMMIYREQV